MNHVHAGVRASIAAVALTATACGGNGHTVGGSGYQAAPPTTNYQSRAVALPNLPFSFDIGIVDGSQYYLADRSNKGVDIFDAASGTFTKTVTGFVGVTASSATSGPNGLTAAGGMIYAGDGNSTVKVVNPVSGVVVATIPTGGKARADEMGYDPDDGLVLVGNDDDSPPFLSFISTATNTVVGKIQYATGTTGLEATIWDPGHHVFLQAVPGTKANKGGQIDVIDPVAKKVIKSYPVTNCTPQGLALGPSDHLMVGCNTPGTVYVLNGATGATLATINQVGGADETWYDPRTDKFYLAANNNTVTGASGAAGGGLAPVFAVVDASTMFWVQNIPTAVGSHSIAVDPASGNIFVPENNAGVVVFHP
ncbi:MAG TPA: hypothetical protein VE591_03715 [Candidatus Acidoferrum sp.]|nr:hypothetical protein [Candidatus Acidoferrum sp.]